jgi:homoaconitate hydratase
MDDVLLQWCEAVVKNLQLRTFSIDASIIPSLPDHPRINRHRLDMVRATPLHSNPNMEYMAHLIIDPLMFVPHISGPNNSIKVLMPLPDLKWRHICIQKAYLVSCTNPCSSNLVTTAAVLHGRCIAPGIEFYIMAASSAVQHEASRMGDWETLITAGACVLPAGCGPCIGLGMGLLEEGEMGISMMNRNYCPSRWTTRCSKLSCAQGFSTWPMCALWRHMRLVQAQGRGQGAASGGHSQRVWKRSVAPTLEQE